MFAGKVTCGVRNETSGQSWPSNTVATDAFDQTVTDRIISSLKAGVIPWEEPWRAPARRRQPDCRFANLDQ